METKRVARRNHSAEFRGQILAACRKPGASVAAIGMRDGLNANVIYWWLRAESQKKDIAQVAPMVASVMTEFLPVQLPPPVAAPQAVVASTEIRMKLHRGGSSVTVVWPLQCAQECAGRLREWLR